MQRVARAVCLWSSLVMVAAGCGRDRASDGADPSEWGSGVVRHEGPAAAVVEGPRVKTAQALAAGQWDDPKQMYDGTCAGCHNAGVGPPILGKALPEAYIRYVGRNGLRAMPPFRVTDYTDAELASLATWINAQPSAQPTAPATPPSGPAPATVRVARGSAPETMYTLCSGCHDNGAPPLRGKAFLEGHLSVVVRNGLRGMPAFDESGISDADLTALVAWLNKQPRSAK